MLLFFNCQYLFNDKPFLKKMVIIVDISLDIEKNYFLFD